MSHARRPSRPLATLLLALPLLAGCSTRQAIDIALSRDPQTALSHIARYKVESYKRNPLALYDDVRLAKRNFNRLVELFKGRVGEHWGSGEVVTPSAKRYVKYTQNYLSRAIVDFDSGTVTVETLDDQAPAQSLHNAVVTTLLTPEDPRGVDLYSDRTVRLSGRPYLDGLVADQQGRLIGSPAEAERFAGYLVKQRVQTRSVQTQKGPKRVRYVQFPLVSDFRNRQARRYAPLVTRYADRYGVSRSLVYAVIKTESDFNPYAVSAAPAYGLMQLVPGTGGRDAFHYVKGYAHTPSRAYLFIPENNIELGTAYLGIIEQQYLGRIRDPVSREYCTIAAYNGGAGNVLEVFSRNREHAIDVINGLPASEVYRRLREQNPRAETRRYLVKVLDARREFINI